tara:strand:+ start:649 stop:1017 length:369 start_codon:yes stop_codon:yes gene_type:complete
MSIKSNEHQSDMPSMIIEDGTTANGPNIDLLTPTTGRAYSMRLDNATAGSSAVYFKIYDAKDVTLGTTEPSFVFRCTAGGIHYINSSQGLKIETGLTTAISASGGKTSGTYSHSFKYVIFGD